MADKEKISVFVASPGGLEEERENFPQILEQLNAGFGDGANVTFEARRWEDLAASTGPRVQSIIDPLIDSCDVFIAVFYKRWGRLLPESEKYSSFTESEFYRALNRWYEERSPRIFVFFKSADVEDERDPDEQFANVLKFRQQLEDTGRVLYKLFAGPKEFKELIDGHLRLYAKGELPEPSPEGSAIEIPLRILEEVAKAKSEAQVEKDKAENAERERDVALRRLEILELEAAENAASLSRSGRIVQARAEFVRLASESTNPKALLVSADFFHLSGDLRSAKSSLIRLLEQGVGVSHRDRARSYGYLGKMEELLGASQRAEELYRESLKLYEQIGDNAGVAREWGSIGWVLMCKGSMEEAFLAFKKEITFARESGSRAAIASGLKHIANIYQHRGERDEARRSLHEALDLSQSEIQKAEIESELGTIYFDVDDLDQCIRFHKQALQRFLGAKYVPGVAVQYLNLGNSMLRIGNIAEGEKFLKRSLSMSQGMGNLNGIAVASGSLASLLIRRREVQKAEEYWAQAIRLKRMIGDEVGLAHQLLNSSEALMVEGRFSEALSVIDEALTTERRYQRWPKVATCLNRRGSVLFQMREYREAEIAALAAIEMDGRLGGGEITGGSYIVLALIKQKLNEKKEALCFFDKAISELGRVGSPMLSYAQSLKSEFLAE